MLLLRLLPPVILVALVVPLFIVPPGLAAIPETKCDKVLVLKSKRVLMLLNEGKIIRIYKISLGQHPRGHKRFSGDSRTPEGIYQIDARNANSHYHLALHISYPNPDDVMHARELGRSPGGNIMIHGAPNKRKSFDKSTGATNWTEGCIALKNSDIEEMWYLVADGTPIEIQP